jgi:hypothetical protein
MRPSPLSCIFAFLAAVLAFPAAAMGADTPPKPASDTAAGKPPLIVRNPDGTFTVQKKPSPEKTENGQKGLTIPPQIVVPTVSTPVNNGRK